MSAIRLVGPACALILSFAALSACADVVAGASAMTCCSPTASFTRGIAV
jgi:hypothetical protein